MSIELARQARRRWVARFPFTPHRARAARDDFNLAVKSLSYRDIRSLCAALDLSPCTIMRWRYHMQYPPDLEIFFGVIQWVEENKPMDQQPLYRGISNPL